MRVIKFRGLSINAEWHIGNVTILPKDIDSVRKAGTYISNRGGLPFAFMVRPETLGQFTGLLDKNGKEIYEGDVVKESFRDWDNEDMLVAKLIDKDRIGFVEYVDRGFWVHGEDFGWEGEGLWNWRNFEIIGNIYENPSLLTPSGSTGGINQ